MVTDKAVACCAIAMRYITKARAMPAMAKRTASMPQAVQSAKLVIEPAA